MKTIVVTILISFILFVDAGFSQNFQWAQNSGATGYANGKGVDADAAGNVYTTGTFSGTANFNGQSLTSSGSDDIFLAKYNSSGSIIWSRKAGGISNDNGNCMATDAAGNSYVAGIFSGTVAFGTFNLTSINYSDMFLAKYNSAGTVEWVIDAGRSNNYIDIQDISIDNFGNSYITGRYMGTGTISTATLPNAGVQSDIFIAKFNSSGAFQWAKSGGSNGKDIGNSVSADNLGNVFITGNISNDAHFDNVSIIIGAALDTACAFIVKYNSSGVPQWGVSMIGSGGCFSNGISVDNLGNCFVTGIFQGNANFDSYILSGIGGTDIFIAMCNSAGNFNWAEKGGSTNWDNGTDIETNAFGDSYITGSFSGIASFGLINLGSLGNYDTYVVKYDKFGNSVWASNAGGLNSSVYSTRISADIYGNAFITGNYSNTPSFGAYILPYMNYDAFTAKISSITNTITGNVFLDYNNDGIKNGADVPYTNRIVSMTPGVNYTRPNSTGDYYLFCGAGNYTMTVPTLPLYHTSNPVNQTANFTTLNNTDANNDFAVYPVPGNTDLRISMSYLRRFVPGFTESYDITYTNIGTTIEGGYVELKYDNDLDGDYYLAGTIPPHLSHDAATRTIRWNFTSLSPLDIENIHVEFQVDASLPVATTTLISSASVHPNNTELTPADNSFTLNHGLFNSHDPNDKSVEPSGNLTLQQLSAADYLTYTVRFQNTGNNVAYTVSVLDKLSSKLDVSTFEMLSSSHNYTYSIAPDGTVDWTFNNILLPDNTTDDLGSNGFIKYRIKPKSNVVVGDEISNTASIYFDYNDAIITNTIITKIVPPNKILDLRFRLEAMHPYLDSIKVYLTNSVSPFQKIDSATVYSQLDGTNFRTLPTFKNALSGISYYIVVKHRNSIETWSANPVLISTGDTTYFNFTSSQSQANGNNMVLTGSNWSFYSGDVNQDQGIDAEDLSLVENAAAVALSGINPEDLNGDEFVDASDLSVVENNASLGIYVISP